MGFFDKIMNSVGAQGGFEKEFEKAMVFYKPHVTVGFDELRAKMKQFLLDYKYMTGIDATLLKEGALAAISSIYLNTVLQLQKQEEKAISEGKEELTVDWRTIKDVLFKTQPAYISEDNIFILMTYIGISNKTENKVYKFLENKETIEEVSGSFEYSAKSERILSLFDKHYNAIIDNVQVYSLLDTLNCETATLLYLTADFCRAIAKKPRTGFCQQLRASITAKYNIQDSDILNRVSFYGDFTQGLKSVRGVWSLGDNGFLSSHPIYKCLGVFGDVIRYDIFYKDYQNAPLPVEDANNKTDFAEIMLLRVRSEIDQFFNEIKTI